MSLIAEIRRRKVFRVAVVALVRAWALELTPDGVRVTRAATACPATSE